MPGPSKVIVLDPDARAARQIQLGFQREGVPAEVASPSDLPTAGTGLVIVGGSDGEAVDLVRKARERLQTDHVDAPIVFAGRSAAAPRKELEAAGADEVLAQPAYLRDVVTIGRLLVGQPAGHRSHLIGSLAELTGVLTLVRALSTLGRSATLTLVRGLRRGEVRFFEGEVTSAQVGLIHGQAALHQLLLWTDARFEFHHEDIVRRQQIPLGREELFSDAERFLAGIRDSSGSLSPSMVLEQDALRIQQLSGQIPNEVHGVLRMFDGHRVLADVLEDSPYRVFETLRVAQRAIDVGLLRKAQAPRPKATWRAVLAIEEWLVGRETRDDVVARGVTENTAPIPKPDETKPKKKSSSARQRKKRRASAALIPAQEAEALKPPADIDWGSLVPRSIGAEVGPLSGVVPTAQRSGEIVLPTASRDEPREKLESLDTHARERIFPTELAEPSVVVIDDTERAKQEAERAAAALAIAKEAADKAKVEAGRAQAKKVTDAKDLVSSLIEAERNAPKDEVNTPSVIVTETPTATVSVHDRVSVTRTEQTARLVATPEATVSDVPFLAVPLAQQPTKGGASKPEAKDASRTGGSNVEAKPGASNVDVSKHEAKHGASNVEAKPGASNVEAKPGASNVDVSKHEAKHGASNVDVPKVEAKPGASNVAAKPGASNVDGSQLEAKPDASNVEAKLAASNVDESKVETRVESKVGAHAESNAGAHADSNVGAHADSNVGAHADSNVEVQANVEPRTIEVNAEPAVGAHAEPQKVDGRAEPQRIDSRAEPQRMDGRAEPRPIDGRARSQQIDAEGGTPGEPTADARKVDARPDARRRPSTIRPPADLDNVDDDSATRPFVKAELEPEAVTTGEIRSEPAPRRVAASAPKIEVNLDDDRPPAATGEIRSIPKAPTPPPSVSEPSILVSDLQAAHSAVSAAIVEPPKPAAPKPPDAATAKAADEVLQVRRDATGAFSKLEEEFFKAGTAHEEGRAPLKSASDSFDDLDEGYQRVGFWDRLLGRKPKR